MKRHVSMNRFYRLIWSRTVEAWIAVAETTRKRRKSPSGRSFLTAAVLLSGPVAHAAPSGGPIISGAANISQSGLTTTIHQTSTNLSLGWKTFNIAPQETVDFLQPSAVAIAINRFCDTNGTQIFGLNANGQIYLINPNGILFGQGAVVNVGGLVASTLNLNNLTAGGDSRTLSGTSSASVVNEATINASNSGSVALVGNRVNNQGLISAQMGTVALAAGSAATLTFSGNSLLHLQPDRRRVTAKC